MPCMCGGCPTCLRDQGYPTACVVCDTSLFPDGMGDPTCHRPSCDDPLEEAEELTAKVRKLCRDPAVPSLRLSSALTDLEAEIAKVLRKVAVGG